MSAVTKITFPPQGETGMVHIRVYFDGKLSGPAIIVGEAIKATKQSATWTVYLWSHVGEYAEGDEFTFARTLNDLRATLHERITARGKWWQ